MFSRLVSIIRDESGTAPIEYGIIAVLISIIAVSSMNAIGGSVIGYIERANAGFR